MRHWRLLLISIFIIAILTTSSMAAIRTVTYTHELFTPDGYFVDWNSNHIFPYFDPAMGRLISVYFSATLNATLYGEAENRALAPVPNAWMTVDTDMYVEMLNGQHLPLEVMLRVPKTGTVSVGAFDGNWDFEGSSAFNGTDANDTWDDVYYVNAADINDYVGIGTFNLPAVTSAISQVHGGGSWYSNITTLAWSNATITYTYDDSRCLSGYKIDGCTGLPLSGWNITVSNGTQQWDATTNTSGFWQVCGLENDDTYTVCEVLQSGWAQTSSPVCHTVTLAGINITDLNFTNQNLYCISGKKINACTGNGLSGWDVVVKNASNGLVVGQNRTINGGSWQVCGLVPGEYQVSETLKSGYKNITNLTQNVTLNCENKTDINFINMQLRTLGGRKIDDCTGQGLNGWTIIVYNATTNTTYTTTTSTISGTPGSWRITNLIPGYYQVSEVLQSGWINVTPTSLNVLLPCNRNKQDVDFHNKPLRCVSGYKLDACTDEGISDWNVTLTNSSGSMTTQTGPDGKYEFCNLVPGEYTITEDSPSGYMPTGEVSIDIELNCTNQSNQNFTNQKLLCISGYKLDDCDGALPDWNITLTNGSYTRSVLTDAAGRYEFCNLAPDVYTLTEELQSGWMPVSAPGPVDLICNNATYRNFTNQKLLCISGYKLDDCDGALPGWNVTLTNGSYTRSVLTDAAGRYEFCNLAPDVYTLTESLQSGWMPVIAPGPVDLICNNATYQNFTNQKLLCISGYKVDNCDGGALPGWNITLTNGSYTRSVLTDAAGRYEFCNLAPDVYTLTESLQSGWMPVNAPGPVDLICNNATYQNFTNQKLLCISGRKTDEVTSQGLAGWEINITDSSGQLVNTTATNETGYYRFCNLLPDNYIICEILQDGFNPASPVCRSVPLYCSNVSGIDFSNTRLLCLQGRKINECTGEGIPNWEISYWSHQNSGPDHPHIATTNETGYFRVCNLTPGIWQVCEEVKDGWRNVTDRCVNVDLSSSDVLNLEFRNAPLGCLSGYKLNEGGNGLAGWTIEVRNASGLVNSSVTDSSGFWQVCGLHPGIYEVSELLQGNYNNLTPSTVTVDLVDCPEGSLINFTNTLPGCIEGFKLNYTDGKGLEGWTIEVRDSNGAIKGSSTTDPAGHWQVCGLENGTYAVCEVKQPGWMQISPLNPDCYTVVMEGQNVTDKNFTNMELLCLSGHKFHHRTGEGLAGWTIVVSNTTNRWEIITDANGFWQKCNLTPGPYTVCEVIQPGWMQVSPNGCYNPTLVDKSISNLDFHNDPGCNLTLTKTTDKATAKRGEDVTYNITLSNPCADQGFCFTNVTLWDQLPDRVQVVSVSPGPSSTSDNTLYWDIGTFCSGQFKAQIVVRVPITDIHYDMEQGVSGEGFVNVHNDYDTHQGPETITNCAYAKADLQDPISDCATTKIVDPGTELLRREFGSGDYASEELLRLRTENKSIRSETSLSAAHRPTSFALPGNRSLDYGTKWTEKSKAINTITGATMTEEYTFANKIDKERVVDLDKNGSTMKTDVAFTGTGHIGVLKKEEPGSHPKIDPAYEAVEDYTGAFRVLEFVDEYGKSVKSEKNVSGYGYVAVDKRVGSSQRTYESGTGSYQSEELIETPTNYIAKEIQLVHGPTNYSYSSGFATSQNIKWSEGMWSRSGPLAGGLILAQSSNCGSLEPTTNSNGTPPASLISERYSGLDYLDKETVASGLNEMNTEASFSGTADYKVKAIFSNKSGEIDNEERYVGAYDITRRVQLTGVSRYDRPHITVTKDGKMTKRFFNKTMADIMEYTITLTNDGSGSLGPINIRDIFPPGTEYISSSIRPASYSNAEANWTLLNLGIGGSLTLKLELNVTEFAPCSLVNRVMVCGMNGEECVAGAAYHARECGELPCCPPDLVLDKRADQDPADPALIHYTIAVQNKGNSSLAATLTDLLPAGLDYVDASPKPTRHEGQFLEWIVPDLEKGGLMTIEYHVRATMDGVYVNAVHADASAVDGSGYDTADAAARVEVRSTGVAPRTTRYGGWQVPDWNMTSPEQGITVELSPEEDVVE